MKKYFKNYIIYLENIVNNKSNISTKELDYILKKITFFQHERLIHLLVTLSFAAFTLLFMTLGMISYVFLIPFSILIIFLLFYIPHYFFLENSVQYMYTLYDKIIDFQTK